MNNHFQHHPNAANAHDIPTRETLASENKSEVQEHVHVEPILEPEGMDEGPSGLFDMNSIDVMQDTIGDTMIASTISLNAPSNSQTKPEPATIDTLPGHTNTGYVKGARNPIKNYWIWLLTFLSFEWVTPLIFRGFRKPLELHNLWELLKVDTADVLSAKFSKVWRRRQQKKGGLLSSLTKIIGPRFFGAGFLLLFSNICSLVTPYFISFILQYINRTVPQTDDYKGYLWVLGLFLVQCLSQILQGQHFYQTSLVAMRTRTILLSEVYQKSLLLSTRARQEKGSGEIVNLMSLDSQKVGESLLYLHFAWSGIFTIVVSIILLYTLIGWPTFVGLAVMLLILPIQGVIMVLYTKYRKRSLIFSDERIRLINEVINGIKIIKFFTWEESFKERINEVRKNEVTQLFKQSVVRAVIGAVMMGGPVLCSTLTFITFYLYFGYASLTADVVFPAISYFNLMRFPLTMFPMIIGFAVEALISIKRLQEFFLLEEKEATGPPAPIELQTSTGSSEENNVAIEVRNASFIWENPHKKSKSNSRKERRKRAKQYNSSQKEGKAPIHPVPLMKQPFILENINLEIKKGQLIMIVGAVGSGKSSLVQALLGEMPVLAGTTSLRGTVAYCPQQAWVQNATIRDNISFGKPFDEERYQAVLDACNLRQDLLVLPGGDFSEIGEKGINLSGGQRHRVQLARATYNDADIVILDDPLSALDAHVGRAIFEQNICGFMKGKTRVLVTHQLQYLNRADEILVVDQGDLVERGSFTELAMRENGVLARLINEYSVEQQHEEEEIKVKESKPTDTKEDSQPSAALPPPTNNEQQGKLISAEERAVGGISFKTIWKYLGYMGGPFMGIFLVLLFMVAQAAIVAADAWLSQWISRRYAYLDSDGTPVQMYIYLALGLCGPIFVFLRDLSFLLSALLAAFRMHRHLLVRVLKAPMSFFDTTPIGRILSRFAKDQENVDTILIVILNQFFTAMMQVLSCIAIIAYAVPWFLLALLPIMIVYFAVQQLYRRTSREVKKLDGLSRSPLYAHFSESLSGISTIRSYGRSQEFVQMNRRLVDLNQRAYFAIFATQRWLTFRLDIVGSFIVLAAGILMMATRTSLNAGVAGLAFSYALQVTQFLSYAVRQATDAEAQMNSVERILYYSTEIPNEKASHVPDNTPPQTWPEAGQIEFKEYEMRYRPELPPVLKDINLTIMPGEKIGVIGRSGAGKSSLMLAIFRIVEASKGAVFIDNVDINQIGLTDLRSRLSIIPQEPVIFSGTVRSNIDPFAQYSEEHLWNVLEKAHLSEAIKHLPQLLDSPVVEGGENFSVGQRQLLCLARALTKDSKVLILDEATANVDMETDALIQRTIRQAFAHCTRLTIAHRLNTILDSDRILVMDKGTPAEFDTPLNLLMNENSIFVSLVNETGEANAGYIRKTILEESKEPSLSNVQQQQASSSTS